MTQRNEFPHLGQFVVDGYSRRAIRLNGERERSVPVLRVRKGRNTYSVVVQDRIDNAAGLGRLFPVGSTLDIHGLLLGDVAMTWTGGIVSRAAPRSKGVTDEQALEFLYT